MGDATEIAGLRDEEWETFAANHPPTVDSVNFTFQGFANQEECQQVANAAQSLISFFSRLHPLQDLDGVTYAFDYAAALRDLDRGVETSRPLAATSNEVGQGIAMAPVVMRDGKCKTRVVISGELGLALLSDDPAIHGLGMHTLAHELGHAAEHALMDRAYPGVLMKPFQDRYQGVLYPHAHMAWDEYFAERTAATFGPNELGRYRELLAGAIARMDSEIVDLRAKINPDDNTTSEAVASGTIEHVGQAMKFCGYLFGHADGLDLDPFEGDDALLKLVEELELSLWFDDLHDRLRELYDRRDNWKDFSEQYTLTSALEAGCKIYGVTLKPSDVFAFEWRVDFY